jgi:hypothetical protein
MLPREPKIMIWDIETSFMLVAVFGLKNDYINPDNIVKDWSILCGAWKWLGNDEVHTICVDPLHPDDDMEVVEKLRAAVEEADIIVHHNGDRFDVKKLMARVIQYGLPPVPPLVTVDTLKEVRKVAGFTSNKLDYLGLSLDTGQKMETSKNLWLKILKGNLKVRTKALQEMLAYNIQDVHLLEKVYLRLRPYMKSHPNLGLFTPEVDVCPSCGGTNLQKQGVRHTRTSIYQRFQCQDCGSWSKSSKALSRTQIS